MSRVASPTYRPPSPTAGQLAGQVWAVLADLPRFLTSPLYRRWHLNWGATVAEVHAAMPGDDLVPKAQYRCTRAITINVAPQQVWPWLVQVGCLRAGFYSDDLLDNLARPSAQEVVAELQHLQTGQWVPMSPKPVEAMAFKVDSYHEPRWLLWAKPDSTWAWTLTPAAHGWLPACAPPMTGASRRWRWPA